LTGSRIGFFFDEEQEKIYCLKLLLLYPGTNAGGTGSGGNFDMFSLRPDRR
jgi:hypothetical protein